MSAAQALNAARAAGVEIGLEGDDLVLEAAKPPSPALIDLLARHKVDIVATLRGGDGWTREDWLAYFTERAGIGEFDGGLPRADAEVQAYACCVAEWLNRHHTGSPPGRCLACGAGDRPGTIVLPFGTDTAGHVWVHATCWPAWYRARRAAAVSALAGMGIVDPIG